MSSKIKFIGVIEAAKLAEMTPRNVQSLIKRGRGPQFHIVLGKRVYKRDEIIEWRKSRKKLKTGPKSPSSPAKAKEDNNHVKKGTKAGRRTGKGSH